MVGHTKPATINNMKTKTFCKLLIAGAFMACTSSQKGSGYDFTTSDTFDMLSADSSFTDTTGGADTLPVPDSTLQKQREL